MEKQTVRDKIIEIIDTLEGGDEFNINLTINNAMEYAKRVSPVKIEHEYLDYYAYMIANTTLEHVLNVLHCEAEAGRYSYITEKKPVIPEIKIGDVRHVIHGEKLVKMRLSSILSGGRKRYVFANCDQSKFVRPLVIELFEDEVDQKAFKVIEDVDLEAQTKEIMNIFMARNDE